MLSLIIVFSLLILETLHMEGGEKLVVFRGSVFNDKEKFS